MRWPLRYQILFPFTSVMLAVVLAISLLGAFLAARRTQAQIERQLHEVAETLSDANFPLTDAVLKQTRGLSGAEFLLTDQHGALRATSRAGLEPSRMPRAATTNPSFTLGEPIEVGSRQYFHTAVAVRPRGNDDAGMLLHILYPRHDLQEARWQAAYPPLLVGSVLLGVVILLAIVIAGRLSRPILELRRQLSLLLQGDFQPVPLPERNDELRDLVGSVNLLGDQLDELRRAIKRSERLAILGQLSGGLAHQLRNSVTGARLAVQLHQRHCHQIDRDSLTVALRQLSLTETHLERFLTVGRPSVPRRGRCDLRKIVNDLTALLGPSCNHHNVALEFDDEAAVSCELSADADQLRQLLVNLVLNGIEAAGSGGWVRIELARASRAMTLRVRDSGRGPDPELLDRLFEPFATGKPDGIGLGLSVAKAIAEAHGGTIAYTGQRPTCFEVVLPQDVSMDEGELTELNEAPLAAASDPAP